MANMISTPERSKVTVVGEKASKLTESLCCVQAFGNMFGTFLNKLCNILAKNQD